MSLCVLINGRQAAIKQNSTFDLVAENPLFTDAETYTLNIEFPLRGCRLNTEIFGDINRHGHTAMGKPFDMEIRSGATSFKGVGVITSVTETECKVQFLSGKSSENYYSDLDDIYINELDLGSVPMDKRNARDVDVAHAWGGHEIGMNMVAIPYVNENTGNIINDTEKDPSAPMFPNWAPGSDHVWKLPDEAKDVPNYNMQLSWFPYLIDIAKKICDAIGLTYDFSEWENSKWNELLVCNAIPPTWDFKWSMLLPRWSVLEFFQKLEPLIEGHFNIDLVEKNIGFTSYRKSIYNNRIVIDKVVDSFTSDVYDDIDMQCKLISIRYVGYATSDKKPAKAYSCDWLIDQYKKNKSFITDYDTPEELSEIAKGNNWNGYLTLGQNRRGSYVGEVSYIKSVDRYVSNRVIQCSEWDYLQGSNMPEELRKVRRVPMLLNQFGARNIKKAGQKLAGVDLSLDFVPVVIDDTDMRRMIFMPIGEFEDNFGEPLIEVENKNGFDYQIWDSITMRYLEEGDVDVQSYFDKIAVGFYPGATECYRGNNEIFPIIDNFDMNLYWEPWYAKNKEYTLALSADNGKFEGIPNVNKDVKFEFSFITDTLPDVKQVFVIRGHQYLCEKLTASFSTEGMSQLVKGTFWRII